MDNDYKCDKTDLEIIENLWDGRTPYSDIADKIGLTTNTVRNRVNKLRESGVLQIIGLVELSAIEGHNSAFIGINILPAKVKTCLEQILELKGIVGATRVAGRFDVIAVLMYNNEFTYEHFLEEEISKVEGIISTETFFTIGRANFQLRYVL